MLLGGPPLRQGFSLSGRVRLGFRDAFGGMIQRLPDGRGLSVNMRSRRAQRNLVFGIHVENADCRPANAGFSDQMNSAPLKMVVPILQPGME
jgi:hypothetical protein